MFRSHTKALSAAALVCTLILSGCSGNSADTQSHDAQPKPVATKPAHKSHTPDSNVKVEITPDAGTPKDEKTAIIVDLTPANPADAQTKSNAPAQAPTSTPTKNAPAKSAPVTSTPTRIAHAVSTKPSATYPASYTATPGTYKVNVIGTVNPNGSVTKATTKHQTITIPDQTTAKDEPSKANDKASPVTKDKADQQADHKEVTVPVTTQTIPAHEVTPEDVKEIVTKTADAVKHGDETLTGDAGKELTERLEDNVDKTTIDKDAKQEATQTAQEAQESAATTEPTKPATTQPTTPEQPAQPATTEPAKPAQPTQPSKPVCTPTTRQVPVYKDVWVPNVVTVVDVPEKTEKVYTGMRLHMNEDPSNVIEVYYSDPNWQTKMEDWYFAAPNDPGYWFEDLYETKTTPAVTHTEDRGHYEKRQTGTRTETVGCK